MANSDRPRMMVRSRRQPGSNSSRLSVWLPATAPRTTTTGPIGWFGIKLLNEMKNTLTRAVKELSALARRPASACGPKTRSGAIDAETKSRPISAALAWVLAARKFAYEAGIIYRNHLAGGRCLGAALLPVAEHMDPGQAAIERHHLSGLVGEPDRTVVVVVG